jgi:hypothetical protein
MIQERKQASKHQKMGAGILMGTIVVAVLASLYLMRNTRKLK